MAGGIHAQALERNVDGRVDPDSDSEEARTLRPLQAAVITYRIAFGPRAGQKVLTLRGAAPRDDRARQPLCADIDGFSLHAAENSDQEVVLPCQAAKYSREVLLSRSVAEDSNWPKQPERPVFDSEPLSVLQLQPTARKPAWMLGLVC